MNKSGVGLYRYQPQRTTRTTTTATIIRSAVTTTHIRDQEPKLFGGKKKNQEEDDDTNQRMDVDDEEDMDDDDSINPEDADRLALIDKTNRTTTKTPSRSSTFVRYNNILHSSLSASVSASVSSPKKDTTSTTPTSKSSSPKQRTSTINTNTNTNTNTNNKQRRLLLNRNHYYYDNLRNATFDDDPSPDTYDAILRPAWLGLGLFLILLAFWILDVLKDPVFGALVGRNMEQALPTAKLISVCITTVLVLWLEYIAHEQQQQQQQQKQQIVQKQQQVATYNNNEERRKQQNDVDMQERTAMDVLNGAGRWSKMETTSSTDYDYYKQTLSDEDDDDEESNTRVPSTIFMTIGIPYCLAFAIMAYVLQFNPSMAYLTSNSNNINKQSALLSEQISKSSSAIKLTKHYEYWNVLGYFWYSTVESFGSIAVATFWSYTNSTLSLHDAERSYGYIISMAQIGAILGTTMVTTHIWSNITLIVAACLIILLHIIVMILYSKRYPPSSSSLSSSSSSSSTTPSNTKRPRQHQQQRNKNELVPLTSQPTPTQQQQQQQHFSPAVSSTIDPTFWSGIYLILKHNYVLLILGVSCLYEISLTCLNYQMTLLGWNRYEIEAGGAGGGGQSNTNNSMTFTKFMGQYGQMVNVCSLVLSSIVFPFLIQQLGLRRTLWIFPTLLFIANILAFAAVPGNLNVLFYAMAILKAMTYSIHDPSKEILYIPTSNAIKYKSKFWIDVVGARLAKAVGSGINAHSGSVVRSIKIASAPSLLSAAALWITCYKAGNQFEQLIASGHIVGVLPSKNTSNRASAEYNAIVRTNENMYDYDENDIEQPVGDTPESTSLTVI